MSLLDTKLAGGWRIAGLATSFALAIALGSCQVHPLYGSIGSSATASGPVQNEMAAIDIEPINGDTSHSDAERKLYNELTFNFERGAEAPPKKYRLRILMDLNSEEVGVEQLADVPAAYTMTMNTSFVLSDIETHATLMTGRSFATASYDFSTQRFANIRAKRDAEQRAAKQVARDIQARIAGYFASH